MQLRAVRPHLRGKTPERGCPRTSGQVRPGIERRPRLRGSRSAPSMTRRVSLSVDAPAQMDDGGPEASTEAERGDRKNNRGRAPDDKARLQRPERTESHAGHQDERRQKSIDIERTYPL